MKKKQKKKKKIKSPLNSFPYLDIYETHFTWGLKLRFQKQKLNQWIFRVLYRFYAFEIFIFYSNLLVGSCSWFLDGFPSSSSTAFSSRKTLESFSFYLNDTDVCFCIFFFFFPFVVLLKRIISVKNENRWERWMKHKDSKVKKKQMWWFCRWQEMTALSFSTTMLFSLKKM